MPGKRSPARLVVALSAAAVLAVFLLYTSIVGGTPSLRPSQLPGHDGRVSLAGKVIGSVTGDPHAGGLRFTLRDVQGTATVPVAYRGSVPDLFDKGRDVVVDGRLRSGVFVAVPGHARDEVPVEVLPEARHLGRAPIWGAQPSSPPALTTKRLCSCRSA